ncbi:MAG TPA: hypothetical protein VJU01_05570, partial [Gaiellaceae bacterium]|nr:hypothetical protein [Gaiellaceae bacterium]
NWRHRRLAVRARTAEAVPFLDVESVRTRQALTKPLSSVLAIYGAADLDVSVIRGGDRRITRAVSLWAWVQVNDDGTPRFGGIRYLSRLNTAWECWGIFDRVPTVELERRSIQRAMPELQEVANLYSLTVY